ncbi:hypothetical protein ABOM_011893 [Aspergillus bombycis]|uniref:Uncharacterized protein n=1 Tax=Aspergillus bombycis TaxID=109264 RepID=A0A1F7ZJ00_9EURO|nr:hypothetical protein ABOM_011893 [Aspergillus bombycis]OGM39430.1 hypothetical protein ABOM_011893 [Aspergillus bombycis]
MFLAVAYILLAADQHGLLDRAILPRYILTACSPTIALNVVMTRSADGINAMALAEVLIANLLGAFGTAGPPVALLPDTVEFEPWRSSGDNLSDMHKDMFKQLALSVLIHLELDHLYPQWT